jgi:hypothetical protein
MNLGPSGVTDALGGAVGDGGADPAEIRIPKFVPDGLLIVHAGGSAGLFSAVIGGWARGSIGSSPVTREVKR